MKTAIITALIIAIGGGTSVAAEGSLPGDTLYPVKIHVNERVASAFHLGSEARAKREATLVRKRVSEMNSIAAEAEVDARARARAEERLGFHLNNLKSRAASLETRGNLAASAEVISSAETSLRAGIETMMGLRDRSQAALQMEEALRSRLQTATEARAEIENKVTASADVDAEVYARRAQRAAIEGISKTETFISRLGRGMENLVFGARERLEVAGRLLAEGEAHLEAGEYREAYMSFSQSLRISQGIRFALENYMNLDAQFRPSDSDTRPERERPEEEEETRPLIEFEAEAESETEVETDAELDLDTDTGIDIGLEAEGQTGLQLSF